jgi:hypothetical protein
MVKTTTALTTLHQLAVLPHLTIAINLVYRRNQILLTSSHLVRQHRSSRLYANTRIGHLRNNPRTFTKNAELFVVSISDGFCCVFFCIINFTIIIFLSLFLPPHFPSFSCTKIHCSPSQLLFLQLLIHSLPVFTSPSHSPNLSPHYPSLLHIHYPLTSLLYQLYTTPAPAILDTSTLHYNRNTPKYLQGPQNLAALMLLPPAPTPFLAPLSNATFTNFPNFCI